MPTVELVEQPGLGNQIITDFLTRDAVATFAPIRRPGSTTS